jgi:alpha-1,2-mannosyltransferase
VLEHRALPALVFLLTSAVYLATITHDLLSLDVWSTNFASWHLAQTGNPWVEGLRLPLLNHSPLRSQWIVTTAHHTVIARSPGAVALGLPAYLLVGGGFSTIPGSVTAALLSAGSVTLLFLALRSQLSPVPALAATLVFCLATPVWSVAADGLWPHTVTVFGICGMAWAATSGRWWSVGALGGITLWGRLHAAVIVAVLGLMVGWRRRDPRLLLRVGLTSAAFFAAQCVWTRWMYDTWNPTGSYSSSVISAHAEQYRFNLVNQLGLWVSPDRGILVWTPVLLVLLPALVRSWRDLPDWSQALVWGGLVYTTLNGSLDTFTGGEVFYGYRYGLEFLACSAPAFALAAPRLGRVGRVVIVPVVLVQMFAFALGATRDSLWIPQTEAWHHNAFVSTVQSVGAAGWLCLALAVAIGAWIGVRAMPAPSASLPVSRGAEDRHDDSAKAIRTVGE